MVNMQLTVKNSELNEIKQKFQGISASHPDLGGRDSPSSAPAVALDPSSLPEEFVFDGVAGAQAMGAEKLSLTGADRAGNRR